MDEDLKYLLNSNSKGIKMTDELFKRDWDLLGEQLLKTLTKEEVKIVRHLQRVRIIGSEFLYAFESKLSSDVHSELIQAIWDHDLSKLDVSEFPVYLKLSEGLLSHDEVKAVLRDTLRHHYQNNSHHPEFHEGGINSMGLVDLSEMVIDWAASRTQYVPGGGTRETFQKWIDDNLSLRFRASSFVANLINDLAKDVWTCVETRRSKAYIIGMTLFDPDVHRKQLCTRGDYDWIRSVKSIRNYTEVGNG